MKRRKTALLLALALSVTAVFTACGGSAQGGSSQAQPSGQSSGQSEAADQTQAGAADQTQTQSGAETPQTIVTSSEPVADKFHIELEEFGRISGKSDYQLVNGVEFAKGDIYDFAQVGDYILSRADGSQAVYSPDGKTVYTAYGSNIMKYNHLYLTDFVNGKDSTLDANGNLLYSTDQYIGILNYDSDYFTQENDAHMLTAINAKGEPVLAGEWTKISTESKGRFIVRKDENSKYAMVSPDGTEIVTSPYEFMTDWLGFSAFIEDESSSTHTVITPGSRIIRGVENEPLDLVFTKDAGASYLVLNTGDFASADGCSVSSVAKGVAKLENPEGKSSLVDVFTGKELVGFEYDLIEYLNDNYIYCETGDDIVIYKTTIVPEY